MIPILYEYGTTDFNNNGLGRLSDALSVTVKEELNGPYEADIEYPLDGKLYDEISVGCTVKILANDEDAPQLFDIFTIERNLKTITIKLRHVSYRLGGYPCRSLGGYWGDTVQAMFDLIPTRAYCPVPFTFTAEYNPSTADYASGDLRSVRNIFLNSENSLITFARGEFKFDNFNVKFVRQRGEDNGVSIRYGKNMLNLDSTEDADQVYTHIIGMYSGNDGRREGSLIDTGFTFPYQRVLIVDCSQEFQSRPSVEQIDAVVWKYAGDIGDVVQSINTSFIPFLNSGEGTAADVLHLGDTANVLHPHIGIGYKKRVTSVAFNSLSERYIDIDVGTKVQTLAGTLERMRRALI